MTTGCDALRLDLGAYALDVLEPGERARVETHLAGCAACRAELADLVPVIDRLATVSAHDLDPGIGQPPAGLFARVVSAASASAASSAASVSSLERRPRRTRSRVLAVAAAVLVLGGGGTAIGLAVSSSSPGDTLTTASASSGAVRVHVMASDLPRARTRLVVSVRGLRTGERCHLVAQAADGSTHEAGRWDATYDGAARVVETTDVPRASLRRLTLYGRDGAVLIMLDV